MNESIEDLKDLNNDALLGKKKASCLSCSKGPKIIENLSHILGIDGKLYYG